MTHANDTKLCPTLKDSESDSNESKECTPDNELIWVSGKTINQDRFDLEYSPHNWRVTTLDNEDTAAPPNRIVWVYLPGRLMTVRLKTTEVDPQIESRKYVVEKSNSNKTVMFHPPEPTFSAALTLAQQIMRGCNGVSFSEFRRRLNISATAWRVHARINDWSDLKEVAHNGRFDYINGVDPKANHQLWQAINGSFLEKSREEITRVTEDERTEGIYAIVPVLGGWKVRKEWYWFCEPDCCDLINQVMMPLSDDGGRLYTDRDAAIDAAEAFSEDRIRTLARASHQFGMRYRSKADVPLLTGGTGQPTLFDFANKKSTANS